ncbi:hypothetical protein [Mesorhizobium sp. M0895]|uniref:hypothetical protein n=1 Tax=Mesorhizobium sp. M0895 TaxID=2957019 RepID=UPI00333BB1B2
MTGVIIRILLRYAAGALVAKGLLAPEDGASLAIDPDVTQLLQVGAGFAISAATEGWYWIARKFGWST